MNGGVPRRIVIVGGGLAAVSAIEALRSGGYDGGIRLLCDETLLPYDRPPLSKGFLAGESGFSDILLHDESWYREQRVDCELGSEAVTLEPVRRQVLLKSGSAVEYDKVLLVTGARARTFEGIPSAGVPGACYLRTAADASRISASARKDMHVVMLGGGVIGLETAATLRQGGCRVTVLEAGDRIMARFFPAALSDLLSELHVGRGADIRVGVAVERLEASGSGWNVHLRDGSSVTADFMVIGIGVVPNSELAAVAGLAIRLRGIEVDGHGRTAAPGVYAAGDVATFPLSDGRWSRWENRTHARLHAAAAARHMLGIEGPGYAEIPWVWSDQHGFNIQMTGSAAAEQVVLRGSLEAGRLTAFHLAKGRIVGATTINDSRNKSIIRRLIAQAVAVRPEALSDPSVDLKGLASEAARGAAPGAPAAGVLSP